MRSTFDYSVAATVLLKNPCTHIDFVHRALVVTCIHGCCSWNIVQHIVDVTWSPLASVAVRIMWLHANFILINPWMCCLLSPLSSGFRCKLWHKDPSFWDCLRSLPNFQTTVAHCLCHCSHIQLDMHLKFCMISFQWTLCIFYFIREFSTFFYVGCDFHWF